MRNLSFSTLGCPSDPVERIVGLARSSGCRGVELRCADDEPVTPASTAADLAAVRSGLGDLHIVCVASYVQVARPDGRPADDVLRHVEIARQLASPFVRVFGGGTHERAVATLRQVATALETSHAGSGVTVLLETHDTFLSGREIAAILGEVGSEHIGALWDAVNPWRAGEKACRTAEALAPWLRHVQLKDVAAPDRLTPVLPGKGAVPIAEIVGELDRIGYDGWLSLEWERAWYTDIPPLDEALAAYTTLTGDL